MCWKNSVTSVLVLAALSQGQTVHLKGRVVQADRSPIAEAVVELKSLGLSARTGADGKFLLEGNRTRLGPGAEGDFDYRLLPDILQVDARAALALEAQVFDLSGRLQGAVGRRLERGSHRIPLAEAFPDPGRSAGVYLLQVRLGNQVLTHRIFFSGASSSSPATAVGKARLPAAAAAKRSAAVDTLRIRKAGFQELVLDLASHSGDLGDLTLIEAVPAGFSVLADVNRDGAIDAKDGAGHVDWAWKGSGAFFVANVDDDDGDGKVDASDQVVNGAQDEKDLARLLVRIPADLVARAKSLSAAVTSGSAQVRLFEKLPSGWRTANGALSGLAAENELGIEALQFAGGGWDGFAAIRFELTDAQGSPLASQQIRMRAAPWIMLPNSARTELLYISSTTQRMRPGIDAVMTRLGLPPAKASNPGGQDVWFQDTMEMGYTQIPGRSPMHVVMNARRGNSADNLAPTLLAPDVGLITIGAARNLSGADHWMDWMGNLEVSHPVPGHPLGRIYYGKGPRTTFHPTIVQFLEAQEVQKPFAVNTDWLVIQHVDEVFNFVPDRDGKAKMLVVSPAAANEVMASGYDTGNRQIQGILDDIVRAAKAELGLGDADIIRLPTFFSGGGSDYAPVWSSPVNSVHVNGTVIAGDDEVPAAVKAEVEKRLAALGLEVAWVDDSEYHPGGGNVHCGTNTKKTPLCRNFTECL